MAEAMRAHARPIISGIAAAAAVFVLAAWADGFAAHGLTAEWRQAPHAELVTVARTTEHRTTFPNENRALSRYVQNWPFQRWGVPDHLPALDARLLATLRVPPGAPRSLSVQSPNAVRLFVDGVEVRNGRPAVAPGVHEIQVYWYGSFTPKAGLKLRWAENGAKPSTIPSSAFTPVGGSWTPLRIVLWVVAPLLALLLGVLAYRVTSVTSIASGRRRAAVLATTLLLLIGLGYRLFDYQVMPEFRENPDELFATWNGWQLLTDGTTRGWSLWPSSYGDMVRHEPFSYFRKRPYHNIVPYLEHPPLFHLMVGGVAKLAGATNWAYARLRDTRLVPIALSLVVLWLTIAVGRRIWPDSAAPWFGGLLLAVLPMIVLQSRVIKEEDLVAPLGLLSVLFYLRWRDSGEQTRDLVLAGLVAGLATLAKVPGFTFVPALMALLFGRGRPREALIAGAVGVGVASLLLVYGAYVDWRLFWFSNAIQAAGRPAHWNLFPRFFDDPLINHNLVGRPWLLFLWLAYALGIAGSGRRAMPVLTVPPLLYLLAVGLASGNWTFGWYLIPVYPFLCLGAGRFLQDLWDRPDLFRGVLFVTLALMYGLSFTHSIELQRKASYWHIARTEVTIFLIVFLLPYALCQMWRAKPLRTFARFATAGGLALLVVVSGFFVVRYDALYETHKNFDRIEFFDR